MNLITSFPHYAPAIAFFFRFDTTFAVAHCWGFELKERVVCFGVTVEPSFLAKLTALLLTDFLGF